MDFLKKLLCLGCRNELAAAACKIRGLRSALEEVRGENEDLTRQVDELHVRLNAILKMTRPDLPVITWEEGEVTHVEVGLPEARDPEELGDLVLDERGRPFSS